VHIRVWVRLAPSRVRYVPVVACIVTAAAAEWIKHAYRVTVGPRRSNARTQPRRAFAFAQAEPFMYFGREVAASSRRVVVDYALPQVGGSHSVLAA